MKKLVFAAFAAIALTASVSFVSCGGNATTADSATVADNDTTPELVENSADTLSGDTLQNDTIEGDI